MKNIFLKDEGMLQLCKALGMPGKLITTETTHLHIPCCFIAAYTYGEIQTAHPPLKDQSMKEWFGEQEFGEGRLARELATLRDGKRQVKGINLPAMLDNFAEILANSIVMKQGPFAFDPASMLPPPAFIEGSDIVFGGNHGQKQYRECLQIPINSVLALDPGVRALNHIDQLVQLCVPKAKADPLFQYVTINPFFLTDLLTTYFNLRCQQISKDRRLEKLLRERDIFSPIEGDLATSMQKIIALRQRRKEPIACFDVVLYASYHSPRVTLTDAQQVIKNAYELLHPGGTLLLGFPMTSDATGSASGDDLLHLALQSGFALNSSRSHIDKENPRFPAYTFLIKSGLVKSESVKSESVFTLVLPQTIYEEMVSHVMNEYPQMACGILGSQDGQVIKHYPTSNVAHNPKAFFEVDAKDMLNIDMDLMKYDGKPICYVSYPSTTAYPSESIIHSMRTHGLPFIIFSCKHYPSPPSCRVFTVDSAGRVIEGKLELIGQRSTKQADAPSGAPLTTPNISPILLMDARDTGPAIWKVGDLILDKYEVMGILGEGGMGVVYKIYHRPWNMVMAVKSPRPEIFAREGGKENFTREAETWVNLGTYPHLVRCHFVETLGGIPRVFAEYIEEGSLTDWIRRRKLYEGEVEQALERILDIAIQFAWGIHFAHEQGLVHQDIKPANVMMTRDGVAKVTDFGLAKARAMAGGGIAQVGQEDQSALVSSRGMTLAYCSPEQAARQALSRKTDIWSWGLSVLEMFTGEVTWTIGVAAPEVLAGYEPQDSAIPAMPAELRDVLKRCFQQTPEARPATMLEVATELQEIYVHSVERPYGRSMPQPSAPRVDSLINRGNSLLSLGRLEEAVAVSEQAIHLDPNAADAYYNLGGALQELGRLEEALVAYEQAIRLEPSDVDAHNFRGIVLTRLGRSEEALVAFSQVSQLDPNYAPVHMNRGNALRELGRREEALAAHEQALRLDPNLAAAYTNRGRVLLELGRPEEALAAYEQALRLAPNDAAVHNGRGVMLRELGRREEALAAIEQALRLSPNDALAYRSLALVLRELGRPEKAALALQKARALQSQR